MQKNKGKNDGSAEVGPRLGHRHDFKVSVPQVEFDRPRPKSGEVEAAEVAALVGGKDQPVRQSIGAYGAKRPCPVINRQCGTPWSKTRESKCAHGTAPKIQMRTSAGQVERAHAGRARAALAEISFCESPTVQRDGGGVVDLVVCAQKQGAAGIHRDCARGAEGASRAVREDECAAVHCRSTG